MALRPLWVALPLGDFFAESMHNTNLLIHMPPDAACKEHVLPAPNGFFCPVDGDIVTKESLPAHKEHLK